MKIIITLFLTIFCNSAFTFAQSKETELDNSKWNFKVEGDFYFTDPFYILPIVTADKNWLHLEARYNYEELKTFSGWIGYNFSGGKQFTYSIIPMAGIVAGRLTGLSPGLELELTYWNLEFSSQSEFVFDTEDSENNFYYNWSDLSYSPAEWLFFGLSAQRTKAYETDLDIQRGMFAGVSYKNIETSVYYFNPGNEDYFFLLSLSTGF